MSERHLRVSKSGAIQLLAPFDTEEIVPEYCVGYLESTSGLWMLEDEKLSLQFIQINENDAPRPLERTDIEIIKKAFSYK